MTSRFWK